MKNSVFDNNNVMPFKRNEKDLNKLDDNIDMDEKEIIKTLTKMETTIDVIKWLIPLLITMSIFWFTFQQSTTNRLIDSKFDSINTKFDALNQRLTDQERYNDQKIENEVNKKFLEQKK